jgi:hypothetical protein
VSFAPVHDDGTIASIEVAIGCICTDALRIGDTVKKFLRTPQKP